MSRNLNHQRMEIVHCPINSFHIFSGTIPLIKADDVIPWIFKLSYVMETVIEIYQAGISIPPFIVTGKFGAVGQITWMGVYFSPSLLFFLWISPMISLNSCILLEPSFFSQLIYYSSQSSAINYLLISIISCSPNFSFPYFLPSPLSHLLKNCLPSLSPAPPPHLRLLHFPISTYSLRLLQFTLRKSGLIVLRAPAHPNPVSPNPWRNTSVAEN